MREIEGPEMTPSFMYLSDLEISVAMGRKKEVGKICKFWGEDYVFSFGIEGISRR